METALILLAQENIVEELTNIFQLQLCVKNPHLAEDNSFF